MVNNGLTNSLVENIYIRLVGTAISEHNPGVVTSVLGNVYTWFANEIALTGADYVASIQVPTGGPSEAGGWAGVGGYSSVNSINSAAAVFRHELGHNVGSSHCTPGILPYASGFSNGNVATHMCGNNINFYSTPLVNDAMGVPIGDAAIADNGRVWKERAPTVSARQQHTILFDENDTGCGSSALENGRYYIQNINSELYLATDNGNTGRGTKITQATSQATNNQWDLIGVTPTSFRMIHAASGRYIDVPGSSGSAGTDMILWSAHGNANQIFAIDETATDIFTIKAFNSLCLQIQAAGLIEGDTIEQNTCDNSLNTKWRFIPIPGVNILSIAVATTDVSCYGNENGTATATATGGTGSYTFSWSNSTTGTSINNLAPGNYTVTVDDGTTNFPFAFSIKQVAPFDITLTKTQATSLEGANATATVVVSGGTAPYTYAWSNGSTNTIANNLSAGLHTLIITDANSCSLTKEFFIDCPDAFKFCDDGNPSTIGDHIDENCNCVGKVFTCDNGLAVSNVAIGKTATQSSTSGAGDANRAIDGNRDGIFNNGSVAATNAVEGVNAWWQVDLKDAVDITGILINNRTDCCTGRLEDYYVFVSTTPFESDDLTTTTNQAGIVWSHNYQNATPLPDTLIEPNITGRYVRIQSTSDRPLNLAEVGIFGCGVPTSQTITANPLGDNLYELKGFIINNGATINSISIEHGVADFANNEIVNIGNVNTSDTFYVNTVVNIGNATNYQFRIKYEDATKNYYSNDFTFVVNEDYCTPMVDNTLWYKTYRNVALNNLTYNGNGNNYEDKTDFSFGEVEMGNSYTIQLTTPNSTWWNLTFLVYVDLNNDGDFTDYNEIIGTSGPKGQTTDFDIIIPTEDVLINRDLRMRILGHEGGAYTTCYAPTGNFKDFTIRIKAGACAGTGHLVPFYADADKDGFGNKAVEIARNCSVSSVDGYVKNNTDCKDDNPNANPNSLGSCTDDFAGKALDVRGNEGSVVSNNALFQFGTTTDFSVALWMRTSNWVGDATLISTKDWDSGGNKGWNMALGTDDKGIDVNVGDDSNRADLQAGDLNDGEWHHLAATFDRDGNVTLYVDGDLVQSRSMSNVGDISNTLALTIGADSEDDYPFDGLIDEVNIWNKVLTLTEIRAQKHLTLAGDMPNLIAYYQFNETENMANEYVNSVQGHFVNGATRAIATQPVAGGFSNSQVAANGTIVFPLTDFTATFTSQNGATVVASKLNAAPNILPIDVNQIFDEQYWVIHSYDTGSFTGNLTFKVTEDITIAQANTPASFELYGRAINSDATWQSVTVANSADAVANTLTFNGINQFNQFIIVNTAIQNCTFYQDMDGDGFGDPNQSLTQADCITAPQGYVTNNQDFNDAERTAYNGAMEICDNIDNDGNGQIDEGADYDTDNMTFTNETVPTEVYTASQMIITDQIVSVATSTDVRMIAGQRITLKPGFTVMAGANFIAKIVVGCTVSFQENEVVNNTRNIEAEVVVLSEEVNEISNQNILENREDQTTIKVFPNPFKGNTTVEMAIRKPSPINLQIFDINGQLVTSILQNKVYESGTFAIPFQTRNYANGVYYFVLTTAEEVLTEKVIMKLTKLYF